VNSVTVAVPYEDTFFGYEITEVGSFLVFTTHFGVMVRYDGNSVISVGVPQNYFENVEGEILSYFYFKTNHQQTLMDMHRSKSP